MRLTGANAAGEVLRLEKRKHHLAPEAAFGRDGEDRGRNVVVENEERYAVRALQENELAGRADLNRPPQRSKLAERERVHARDIQLRRVKRVRYVVRRALGERRGQHDASLLRLAHGLAGHRQRLVRKRRQSSEDRRRDSDRILAFRHADHLDDKTRQRQRKHSLSGGDSPG